MNHSAVIPLPSHCDDNDQLASEITLLAGQINAANYRLLKLIAKFDDRKGWSGGGTVRSCAHWLNWRCGIAMNAAREKVRVAHCLDKLPLIDAAFASGDISYSKVRAMTRGATPENEDFLLMIARYGTASHVEAVVKKYRHVQRSLDREQEDQQESQRKLVYYQDDDGMWVIHAKLPAEAGAVVVKSIEAVARVAQEAGQDELRDQRQDTPAETRADVEPSPEPPRFQDLLEQTRADALAIIAEQFLATCDEQPQWQGLKGSERCQVMLHVDIDTLRRDVSAGASSHRHCHLDDTHQVSQTTARRLACDASLVTVLEDDEGNVLNIGRRSRTVPAAISRALSLRDRTCRFPGCCESRYVDAHHVQHWADGGETRLDNLVTLCRYHHRQLHAGAFSISTTKDTGRTVFNFTTPDGKTIEPSVYPQFKNTSAETACIELARAAPDVTPRTCIPHWEGENCDYGMAMDALLRRDYADTRWAGANRPANPPSPPPTERPDH